MKRQGIRSFFILLFLIIASFLNVANSSFVVDGEAKQENITINEGSKAVCYNARTGTKYTTIEKALSVAKDDTANNDTIYVIPGTNPTIISDCEIARGDTLCLPYEGEKYEDSGRSTNGSTFADSSDAKVLSNRKNVVYLSNGKKITNNGTITIGGIIGTGPQPLTGATIGSYCELNLGVNSSIKNLGTINCYGYIKESEKNNGSILKNISGGKIYLPFVIYDFRGGSYTYGCFKDNYMPFNVYDLPNCQCLITFDNSSYMLGLVTFQTSAGVTMSSPNIVCPSDQSGLFKIKTGELSLKYTPATQGITTYDCGTSITSLNQINKTQVKVDGDIEFASIEIKIKVLLSVTIDTSKMIPGFCYKYQIIINSGKVTLNNKMKFMSASNIVINSGAELVINNSVCFYRNYAPNIVYPSGNTYNTPYLGDAEIINNGTLTINASFGGFISSNSSFGKTITTSNFANSCTVVEATDCSGSILNASISKTDNHVENATKTLLKKIFDDSTDTDFIYESLGNAQISSNSTYISHNINSSVDYGWISNTSNDVTYGIKFIDNSGSINNPNSGIITSFERSGSNITLENPTNSDTNYVFDGFYYDIAMTKKLSLTGDNYIIEPAVAEQYLSGNHVNIYSKWIDSTAYKYKLKFEYSETTDYQNVTTVTSSENEFMISEGVILEPRSDFYIIDVNNLNEGTGRIIQYVFDGYMINVQDSNNNNKISNHKVDKTGSSEYFTNFKMSGDVGLTILSDGDIITATATYEQKATDYNLDISFDTTKINSNGGTGNASINTVDIFSTLGVTLTYSWSCEYSKLKFANQYGQSTLMTNNSTPWIPKTRDKNIYCTITANNISIATLTKSIQLVIGSAE